MRIHVLHGIHTPVGSPTVRELLPYLAPLGDVLYPDYGYILALETRVANPLIVRSILPYIEPGDIYVGHSNGCAIGYDLMNLGAPIAGAVFIDAALQATVTLPPSVRWADVYFNPGDDVTCAAKVAQEIGLVDPTWGEMGHSGYAGLDPRVVNINCSQTESMPPVDGHSDIFSVHKIAAWGPFIARQIAAHLAG